MSKTWISSRLSKLKNITTLPTEGRETGRTVRSSSRDMSKTLLREVKTTTTTRDTSTGGTNGSIIGPKDTRGGATDYSGTVTTTRKSSKNIRPSTTARRRKKKLSRNF